MVFSCEVVKFFFLIIFFAKFAKPHYSIQSNPMQKFVLTLWLHDYPSLEPEVFTAVLRNSFRKNSCVTISFFASLQCFYWALTGLPFLSTAHMCSVSSSSKELFLLCEHQFLGQHLLIEIRSLSQYPCQTQETSMM